MGGPAQRISWIGVDDLVAAIVAMSEDTHEGHRIYFTTHEQVIDLDELWAGVSRAFGHRVRVIRVPGPVMSGLSTVASVVLPLVGRPNPLDAKSSSYRAR